MDLKLDGFVAGCVGGASSVLASHPLDTVKVRLQTNSSYKGTLDCVLKTFTREGVRGFYKGMSFPLASAGVYNALVFGVYSNATTLICQLKYNDPDHRASVSDHVTAAMIAGAVSVSVGSPIDLVKIRLQTQTEQGRVMKISPPAALTTLPLAFAQRNRLPSSRALFTCARNSPLAARATPTAHATPTLSTLPTRHPRPAAVQRGPLQCATRIYTRQGVRGLYRGAGAMVVRDVPGYACYFLPYEVVMRALRVEGAPASVASALLAGGVAGTVSWSLMHPLDTVKSRIQADGGGKQGAGRKYSGFVHCVTSSVRAEGAGCFFRGLGVNALRGFPQSAALFFGYEMTMQTIGDRRSASSQS